MRPLLGMKGIEVNLMIMAERLWLGTWDDFFLLVCVEKDDYLGCA